MRYFLGAAFVFFSLLLNSACQHRLSDSSATIKQLQRSLQRLDAVLHAGKPFAQYLQQQPEQVDFFLQFRDSQLTTLQQVARKHGIQLQKYQAWHLLKERRQPFNDTERSLLLADLIYSLAQELRFGSIAPEFIDASWRRHKSPQLPVELLRELAPGPYFQAKLEVFAPQNPGYQRLAELLLKTPLRSEPSLNNRHYKILANMERWRWLDSSLGRSYVIVNVANARLALVHKGETLLSSRVIVGRLARQTPVFSATIRSLVWRPNWTVPATIWQQDLLPRLSLEKDAFARSDYHFYRKRLRRLEAVSAEQVMAMDPIARKDLVLIQSYSPINPLGPVKIGFANPYQIYLHGTPDQELFDSQQATLSSGCVRVEKARQLAEILSRIGGAELPQLAPEDRHVMAKLRFPIPIHMTYFTLWVDRRGRVFEAADPYKRDQLMTSLLLHTRAKVKLRY